MRQQQKSNRARGRGNRKGGGGGNNVNRVYESAGPEGKVRGTPQQIMDKYLSLARDAQTSGDRVTAENFLQHAEHYQRILIQALGSQAERRETAAPDETEDDAEVVQETARTSDDEDAPEESAPAAAAEGQGQSRRRRSRRTDQPAESSGNGAAAEAPGIEGLTTIDTVDGDAGELLVSTEEISSSQPRRRSSNGHAAEDVPGEASNGASDPDAPNVVD